MQLPLTSIVEIYKGGKVRAVMMLRDSSNPKIRESLPDVITARKWKAEEETDRLLSTLKHRDIVGAIQTDRRGIGADPFKPFSTLTRKERRDAVSSELMVTEAERRELHLIQCAQQGQVVRMDEKVLERKLSWNEVWNWTTSRLSFLIRSTYNVLPSPTNLVWWKTWTEGNYRCGKRKTLKHILSNSQRALNRYIWRHNEVLKIILDVTKKQIDLINSGKQPLLSSTVHSWQNAMCALKGWVIYSPTNKSFITPFVHPRVKRVRSPWGFARFYYSKVLW